MRKAILFFALIILVLPIFSQTQTYKGKDFSCNYNISDGMFNGEYSSQYPNGNKKCEGEFLNNQRVGKWSIWDSVGNLKMTRVYKNAFEYERTFPEYPKNGPYKLLSTPNYTLKYDSNNLITYFHLLERMVFYGKRTWETAYFADNQKLFNCQQMMDSIVKAYKYDIIRGFLDEDFTQLKPYTNLTNQKIIGFKIKQDIFFDTDRLISETRIVGICPIIQTENGEEELCWFYYPEIRRTLSKIIINKEIKPHSLKTMEDVFFFRYFNSVLYKEENVFDKPIPKEKIKEENIIIKLNIIDDESNCWLSISK